jgi:hypothetical protein
LKGKGIAGLAAVALALAVGGGVLWRQAADRPYSNIFPADYVGPDACARCHEDSHQENFDSWKHHSHRTMNQNPTDESVKGDFSGVKLRYGRGHVVFHREGKDFVMSIYEGDRLVRRHLVTRTVGSLYVQYYIGRQTKGPEPRGHRTYITESKLPFGYSIALKRWLPEVYFDSTFEPERVYLEGGPQRDYIYAKAPTHNWNTSCLNCHNTYPYVARLWKQNDSPQSKEKWRGGFPREDVSWRGPALHEGRLRLGPRARALHGDELVTVGISCESCHFGGREHAVEERPIRFVPTAPELTVRSPGSEKPLESDRKDPRVVNSICGQCHNADLDKWPDGSQAVNSSEALAMGAGACAGAIKCTDCHNPHEAGPGSGTPDLPGHVEACLGCHPRFEDAGELAAHTRHSASVNCLDCHMPRTVSGLDTVVRSHFISKPTDPRMLARTAPNACNLCHLDRSLGWTLRELEAGWGYHAPADRAEEARREEPLGPAWLSAERSFLRAAAAEAYARSPAIENRLPLLLRSLDDEQAFNRTLGLIAVEKVLGRRIPVEEYDLLSPPALRARQAEELASSRHAGR